MLATAGQSWTNAGLLLNPGATASFNLGGASVSATQPMIQVNGNLQMDVSDTISFSNTTLTLGMYPLIGFSGSFNLTGGTNSPTVSTSQGGVVAGLSQNGNVIDLTVSGFITTEPPALLIVPLGSNGTISISATGNNLSYQWYGVSQGQLSNGTNFLGVNTSTLTITNAQDLNADTYYVIVTGAAGSSANSTSTIVWIGSTNIGPFSPTNWPGSLPTGTDGLVDYCVLDPNANFTPPPGWNDVLSLNLTTDHGPAVLGTYDYQQINSQGYLSVQDPNWKNFENEPVIDILVQVYVPNTPPATGDILEGQVGTPNTLYDAPFYPPANLDNEQWNWYLFEITNRIDQFSNRTVGDTSFPPTSGGGYGGVNNGTLRFDSQFPYWAFRAIAFGPQGAFGTTNQVDQIPAPAYCPPEADENLAWVDFNQGQTNYLEVINNAGLGETYVMQSGVGPADDLRTAIQTTGCLMNFGILSNYLGYPCNPPLNMEVGIEFYDDPNLTGTIISPYQYATDPAGDVTSYTGLTYTTLGTGKWLKLAFTIPAVDVAGVGTSPLTGGPTMEFSSLSPWIDRVELGVYQTGTNALAGQTPDPNYQLDPLVGQTNYGYYAEWNPSAGIIDNLGTAGFPVSYAGPTNNPLICEVPDLISAANYRIQFGLSNAVFGSYQQGNVDLVMSLTYYDDPALAGASFALSEYFTWLVGGTTPDPVLPGLPYGAATVLQGTGTWTNSTFELPNVSLYGVYGSTAGNGVVIWEATTNVRVSAAQLNAIRPAGPFEGIDYLQTLEATTAATNMSLIWRGTADVQATTNLLRPWTDLIAVTNTLTNTYMPPINTTTPAEFFRLSVPAYPPYLGLPYTEGLIQNGDFLANAMAFTNSPGYIGTPNPAAITDWTSSTANQGINGAGVDIASGSPFAPNGASQYTYAFIQNPGNLTQDLSLATNTTYQLSFYAAGRSTDSGVVFQVQIGDNSQVYVTSGNVSAGNDGFTQYTYPFTTPSSFSGTPTIQLQNVSASGSGVTVDFADVSLTPVAP